jgi:hypothetical protein
MSTSVSPDTRRIWRGVRVPLAILALIVAMGLLTVLAQGDQTFGALEPGSYEPGGSRALAQLLRKNGVEIETVRTVAEARAAASSATLLVTDPELVRPEQLTELVGQAANIVLVAPRGGTLAHALPSVQVEGSTGVEVRSPGCTVAAAVAAGDALLGGITYRTVTSTGRVCYGNAFAQVATGDGTTATVLGAGDPLTNAHLSEDGNAALGLRLLGRNQRLVWYLPSLNDPALDPAKRSFYDLIPHGWRFGVIQLGIAAALIALWRGRRLGPVVTEPLPVVVRAAETAEGRARLYRKAGATDHAGEILREAVRARLRPLLGLPVDAGPAAVVESAARRSGWDETQVGELLYGPPPADDPALVRLVDALDMLEAAVVNFRGGTRGDQ